MGRIKALLPHPDGSGRSLVRAAAETLLTAGLDPLFVVLGHSRRELEAELVGCPGDVRRLENANWRHGMLSSLQTGIGAACECDAEWAVVAPVDLPFLSAGLVGRLLAGGPSTGGGSPLAVVPATPPMERRGGWGLPVALHRRLFTPILSETPAPDGRDRGAGPLLRRHRARLRVVPATERELSDVDDPASYRETLDRMSGRPVRGAA